MDSILPADLSRIAQELQVKRTHVEAVAELRAGGAEIPFIARYRKARTDALPEEALRAIDRKLQAARRMQERRAGLQKLAGELNRADDAFHAYLAAASSHAELDDLAGALHPRKMGYGDGARARGLEPVADAIWREDPENLIADPAETLAGMVDADKGLDTVEEVQRGIGMILAERLARHPAARGACRPIVQAGKFVARPVPGAADTKLAADFKQFAAYGEPAKQASPQKVVAVHRGERLGALVCGIEFDRGAFVEAARAAWPLGQHKFSAALEAAAAEGLALLATDLEQEVRRDVIEQAEEHVAKLLQRTVRNMLLQPGLAGVPILAVDPGMRLGVRWAALDAAGNVLDHGALTAVASAAGPRRRRKKKRSDAIVAPEQQSSWAERKLAEVEAAERGVPLPAETAAAAPPRQAPPPRPPVAPPARPVPPALPADSFYRTTGPDEAAGDATLPEAALADIVVDDPVAYHPVDPLGHADAESNGEVHAEGVDGEHAEGVDGEHAEGVDGEHAEGDEAAVADGPPQPTRRERAKTLFRETLAAHGIKHVALGAGIGSHEVEDVLGELVAEGVEVQYALVPDAAAGAYANSAVAREELPDLDPGARRAVALGRRLRDPLQELLKVDPLQWGLGPLQGDVAPRLLKQRLDDAVQGALHEAGLDANTAGFASLRRLCGMDDGKARALVAARARRPFASRLAVQEGAEMDDAPFAQAAGFLRVVGGEQPLDGTWVHPESYPLAEQLLAEVGAAAKDIGDPVVAARLDSCDAEALAAKFTSDVPAVWDTLEYLARPGLDARHRRLAAPLFAGPQQLDALQPGQRLRGTALNVVDFGVFVDIGLKEGGLVHLSEMATRFVPSPHELVSVGDVMDVWVLKVDAERKRVSLSMIDPERRRPPNERRGGGGRPPRGDGRQQQGDGDQGQGRFQRQGGQQDRPRGGGRDDRGPPQRRQGGGPGRPQFGRGEDRPTREYSAPAKPKPLPKLSSEKLEGRSVLHGFGELKAFFEAKKEPHEKPHEPPAPPPAE